MDFESERIILDLQDELLKMMAKGVRLLENSPSVIRKARLIISSAQAALNEALKRDIRSAVYKKSQREIDKLLNSGGTVNMGRLLEASRLTDQAYREARAHGQDVLVGMGSGSAEVYTTAYASAAGRVDKIGERAMIEAVQQMAENGIHAYTYTDKNGKLVRVPADVGIRRAVYSAGLERQRREVLSIARDSGRDLIEISCTAACRPTHKQIDGKIFSLSGAKGRYPAWTADLEALLHECNCGHEVAIYYPEFGSAFDNPLDGTGVTQDEARELIAKQRYYENRIRKQTRAVDSLNAADLDSTAAVAKLRATQAQLREHIAGHPKLLRRELHRENVYSTRDMMAKRSSTVQ